jgi:hypothetical protein
VPLILPEPYGNTASDAFRFAQARGVLPTWMGTAELADLEARLTERAVFSARTTNAVYLEGLKERIQRLIADGYEGDQAQLRLELKSLLAELGYDPINGFPGDAKLGIPAAQPGSLQDLSSDRRINLILDTQIELIGGKGQQQRGLDPAALDLFPAWELVRVKKARVPRDWNKRWEIAGGRIIKDADGKRRLIAHKRDEVWSVLGDRSLFKDALGVSHPPFAFSSGMAWEAIETSEWEELKRLNQITSEPATTALPANVVQMPAAQISTSGLSRESLTRLSATLKNAEAKGGMLTLKSVIGTAPPPPPPSRLRRLNAASLLDQLECMTLVMNLHA